MLKAAQLWELHGGCSRVGIAKPFGHHSISAGTSLCSIVWGLVFGVTHADTFPLLDTLGPQTQELMMLLFGSSCAEIPSWFCLLWEKLSLLEFRTEKEDVSFSLMC